MSSATASRAGPTIRVRHVIGVLALCFAAYLGWLRLHVPPSAATVAASVTQMVNEQQEFDGGGLHVKDVACRSNGGSHFVCKGLVVDEKYGEFTPVSWLVEVHADVLGGDEYSWVER